MSWLKIIAKIQLYKQTIGASHPERVEHAVDAHIDALNDFYERLKQTPSEDVIRASLLPDEGFMLHSVPLLEREMAHRIAKREGGSPDFYHNVILDKRYSDGDEARQVYSSIRDAMRGGEGGRELLRRDVRKDLAGASPSKEHLDTLTSAVQHAGEVQIPDQIERHGDIPIFHIPLPHSYPKDVLGETTHGALVGPLTKIYSNSHDLLEQQRKDGFEWHEGAINCTENLHDLVRHEYGHHVSQDILKQEFLNGTSSHPDSLWNRLYRGTMSMGSTPLLGHGPGVQLLHPHEYRNNYYTRNMMEIGSTAYEDENGQAHLGKNKPLTGYAMSNPAEWFAEHFAIVTHPDYDRIRRGIKTQTTAEGLDYVASKIGRR